MSEELENSLRQAVESYLGKRLAAIDEQLNRLQRDFDEALARVRESSATDSLDTSPLSAAIFAHLQTARAQKLSGAAPDRAQAAADVAMIKRAVEEIERQQTHAEILGALLTASAQFVERAALFVVRKDQAIGWRECEASDPANLELIGGVSLPLSADTLLGRATRSRLAWTGAPGANKDDRLLTDQLGGDPQTIAAVPLVVRGRVVALLYADTVSGDLNALNVDALELLARVAAMAVNLASASPPASEKQTVSETPDTVAKAEPEPAATPDQAQSTAAEQATESATSYTPTVEPHGAEVGSEFAVTEVPAATESPVVSEETTVSAIEPEEESAPIAAAPELIHEAPAPSPDEVAAEIQAEGAAHDQSQPEESTSVNAGPAQTAEVVTSVAPPTVEPATELPPPSAPAGPSFASHYAAPLGSARRYGVSEPALPIEVGEEERRLHNDARRFARLLVSEIKLYNEPKVKEGRSRSDIYERLREDIDRSRQMYDKRVAPPVAARHDYFHQELVNTLAEGDPAKLGANYPGSVLSSN